MINPVCSAIGINLIGEITEPSESIHHTKASRPTTVFVFISICGW